MDKKNFTEKPLSSAKKMLEKGFYEKAEKELYNLSQKLPKEGEIFYLLAQSLFKQEKFKEALKKIDRSISLNPEDGNSYHLAGYCYFYLKDYKKSEEKLLKAIEIKKEDPHINYLLGHLYLIIENKEKSLDNFYTSLKKGASYYDIYECLGKIHFENGEFEKAIKNYKNLIGINPEEPYFYYISGRCFLNLGNFKEAVKFIKKSFALGLSGNEFTKGRYLLALSYCGARRFNSAEKVIRKAIKEEPEYYDYYALLGRILLSRIDYRRARKIFEKNTGTKNRTGGRRAFLYSFYLHTGKQIRSCHRKAGKNNR